MTQTSVLTEQAKMLELAFISRFDVNVESLLSRGRLCLSGSPAKPAGRMSTDDLASIRLMPECRLANRDIRLQFPLNRRSLHSFRSRRRMVARGPRESVTLEGRCIARLREYLVAGADSRPQGVSELTVALDPYVRARQRREGESTVVGFYSPTGWNTEAIDLVSGRNGTSPFVHSSVSLCLVGPGVADLHCNGADGRLAQFIPCFGGSTEQEMVLECKTELHTTLLIDGQVPLARFARGKGFDEMVVQLACAALLREEPDTEIANLRSVGRVLRRKEDK